MIAAADPLARLTERERQIFALLGEGWGVSEIAVDLLLLPATVRHHVGNIRGKLKAKTTRQVADMAVARHVIESLAAEGDAADLSRAAILSPSSAAARFC